MNTVYVTKCCLHCMSQMEHMNKLDEQSADFLMLKPVATGSNHWALNG